MTRFYLTSAVVFAAIVGCTSAPEGSASQGSADTASDLALAQQAVDLISGSNAHCTACHTAGKDDIKRWGASMKTLQSTCLDPSLAMNASQRVACLSDHPTDPNSTFSAGKLGLFAAGVTATEIKNLFSSDGVDSSRYTAITKENMPKTGTSFTQAEFDTVQKWALAGLPQLDSVLVDPDQGPCVTSVTPGMATHLTAMKSDGWGARLAAASTVMFGCPAGTTDASQCLSTLSDVTSTYGAQGTAQKIRKLRDTDASTDFWVRSSADGRFTGVGGPGRIFDHTKGATGRPISTPAPYDPVFMPNNDGFGFAGTDGGITVCRQSVLTHAASQTNPQIKFTEATCNSITDSVYESVGAALDNSVFWMSTGEHVNDYGEQQGPPEGFDAKATTTLTPMVSNGTKYVPQNDVNLVLPYEGDQVLSPSSQLLVERFGSKTGTRGYHVRQLAWTSTGGGNFNVTTNVLATVCLNGAKPVVSYDERFVVTHQYVDPDATGGLPANTSNVFLMDLVTGKTVQITKVKANQNALFPHFRADGWIYFLVKDGGTNKETLMASDAAIQLAKASPTP